MGWAVAPEPERNDTFSFSSHEFVLPQLSRPVDYSCHDRRARPIQLATISFFQPPLMQSSSQLHQYIHHSAGLARIERIRIQGMKHQHILFLFQFQVSILTFIMHQQNNTGKVHERVDLTSPRIARIIFPFSKSGQLANCYAQSEANFAISLNSRNILAL